MSIEPVALGTPDENRSDPARPTATVVLAQRFALAPWERRTLNPFALKFPRLAAALNVSVLSVAGGGQVRVWMQTGNFGHDWTDLSPGRSPLGVGSSRMWGVPLDGRPTRVVVENSGSEPAVLGSLWLSLVAPRAPKKRKRAGPLESPNPKGEPR